MTTTNTGICPFCGSLACRKQSPDFCRHTGSRRQARALESAPVDKMVKRENPYARRK